MLYVVLLHYPVYNKEGKVVTTAIANMDIHDIARAAKTYAASGFYIVNPIDEQRNLAMQIIDHWKEGYGANYNKFRHDAFALIKLKKSYSDVITEISRETGQTPKTIVTGANFSDDLLKFVDLREMLKNAQVPHVIVFGTGSGIATEFIDTADYRLEPIKGIGEYNHLAVRSAVSIVLDRIMGV